jgi:diguanylate cyclase (GGDEF)-like protein
VSTSPLTDPDGTVTGLVGSVLDVTEQHAARELTEQLVGVLDVTPDVVVMADGAGRPLFANRALLELLGEPPTASLHDMPSLGELIRTMIHQIPREVVQGTASGSWHGEVPCRLGGGDELLLSMVVVVEHDDSGSLRLVAGVGRNITHRKRYEAELLHQASHDTLTGLPNRSTLLGHLGEVLVRQQHQPDLLAVLFFDLDNLKQVNDTSGHEAADAMLVAIADRLRHAVRPSDVVGRLGGDEFVAVCEGVGSLADAEDLAERLNEMVRLPVHAPGGVLYPSASVGVVVTGSRRPLRSSPERDASALLRQADQAMYVAKRGGRGRVHLLHADHHDPSLPERASELLWAVVRDELHVAFQPLVSLASGRVTGTESLLRWNHPVYGLLQPGSFLDVAERSGVIAELDGWVLESALDQLARWRSRTGGADELCIHVNVSNLRLGDRRLVPMVTNILDTHGLPPTSLAVEVALRHEPPHPLVVRSTAQLAERGVRVVLDDAGFDSSSLELARRIHAMEVKLDGSVAASMGTDDTALRSFVQRAHGNGLAVGAKWVTSHAQAERLQLAGCDTAQGHAFGSPVRADEFAGRYLERRPGVTN